MASATTTDANSSSVAAAASPTAYETLRFQPWNSAPDVTFWQTLTTLKLDTYRLSDEPQALTGYFSPGRSPTVPARFTIDDSSFVGVRTDSANDRARYEWQAPGVLINTNTLEDFKALDKAAVLRDAADRMLQRVFANAESDSESAMNSFVLVTFADLKQHVFTYWFAFPALVPATPFQSQPPVAVDQHLTPKQQQLTLQGLIKLRERSTTNQCPAFFVLEKIGSDNVVVQSFTAWRVALETSTSNESVQLAKLLFGFVDPCALAAHPGWPLRNYLAVLTSLFPVSDSDSDPLNIFAFRESVHHLSMVDNSVTPKIPALTHSFVLTVARQAPVVSLDSPASTKSRIVGWEATVQNKLAPRRMDLRSVLDPTLLAATSVDLNLKLMRWRQLPALNLPLVAGTRCLLLGAGTLGCFTARSLLAWGFRHLTIVDNATVSHSNPVRQPLFEFADVGKPKAAAAAAALKRIFPLVDATGVNLTIPMAGHALSSDVLINEAAQALATLDTLIQAHDVVFLGTDSRESRWLPTVIAAAKQKLVLNTALGFDSYLVMRHGIRRTSEEASVEQSAAEGSTLQPDPVLAMMLLEPVAAVVESKPVTELPPPLGCYFCNDIVSPRDSLTDRTLDQMCTVTRPGLAPIAAATAVELLVALLHAPDGFTASAAVPPDASEPLAYIPHQLRGFLNAFSVLPITGEAFDKCIACSARVLDAYEGDALGLLTRACNSSAYLEDLTGLSALTQEVDALGFELDVEDSDDDSALM